MFDALPTPTRNDLLDEVRCFLFDHGHELADAVRLIGGAAAEVRVISLALCLERAVTLDGGIRRELVALHALLGLQDVREGDPIETFLLSGPGPASREVETICLLTDLLEDLLSRIEPFLPETMEQENDLPTISTAKAA